MDKILGIMIYSEIALILIAVLLKGIADLIRSSQENNHKPL